MKDGEKIEDLNEKNKGPRHQADPENQGGDSPATASSEKVGPSPLRELLFLLLKIVAVGLIIVVTFTLVFGIYRNADPSMSPSIKDGDLVLYYRMDKEYVASDVLVLSYEGERQARRVIAVAGDRVDITEEGLVLNGSLQQERDIHEDTERYEDRVDFPLTVKEGQVFVLGDGRENATDSRVYGCVDIEDTQGKVISIIRRRGI